MAGVTVSINGIDAAIAAIEGKFNTENLQQGLSEAGEIVVGAAKALCPVSTEATRPGGPHGELRASIEKQVSGNECIVGTNKHYAGYVEFGTCKMAAQPYLVPALFDNEEAIKAAVRAAVLK